MPKSLAAKLRTRRVRKVVGRISPCELYTSEGCMRFAGLGSASLYEARRSGIVKPIEYGKRLYYQGSQLIEWLVSQQQADHVCK